MNNPLGRGLLNGWQISGISSVASGIPIRLTFTGDAGNKTISAAYFGSADVVGPSNNGSDGRGNGLAPVYTCDPRTNGSAVGDKLLNINCIGVPAFGTNGSLVPPYNLRTPTRFNHDLTVFKNFQTVGEQKLQLRVGVFNLFNQSFFNTGIVNDINLSLNTTCRVRVDNVPDGNGGFRNGVCDPTQGFDFTQSTKDNFGKLNLRRGHRVAELVLKYYF